MTSSSIIERQTDFSDSQRAWASLFISFLLFGMAALFYFGGEGGIFSYMAAIPGLFGLLLFYGFVHSLLAAKTPPTTILAPVESMKRGVEFPLNVRQYGPARLESLKVNLICEKSVRRNKSRDLTYPHQITVFESGPFDVGLHDRTEFPVRISVPVDAEPTRDDTAMRIVWRLEIWGKVIGQADFMRPFQMVVK